MGFHHGDLVLDLYFKSNSKVAFFHGDFHHAWPRGGQGGRGRWADEVADGVA